MLVVGLSTGGMGWFSFWPWPSPLRQVTGFPCPFCGMTRSGMALMDGQWGQAFYFNPAGPVLTGVAGVLSVGWLWELVTGRHLGWMTGLGRLVFRRWKVGLVLFLGYWVFHLGMVLIEPKPELVNPDGWPLRWIIDEGWLPGLGS